ncbi:hypothetical protein TB2_023666 [Malus domestica]
MGVLVKLIDALLFLLLLVIAFKTPLIEAQACLPRNLYPDILVDLRNWYTRESGDYLMTEMPDFYVGIMWIELVFQWPLVFVNLYGILASMPWFNITCLSYGISLFTSMVPIFAELTWSGRAPDKLLTVYYCFLSLGVLAILRGLLPNSSTNHTATIGKRPASAISKLRKRSRKTKGTFLKIAAVLAALIDTLCQPQSHYSNSLVELKSWYIREFDDYLVAEKSHFLIGIIWVELTFQWPLMVADLHGIWFAKPWAIYYRSCYLLWSGKASNKMLILYYPAMGFAVLTILRGLLPTPATTTSTNDKGTTKRTAPAKKII